MIVCFFVFLLTLWESCIIIGALQSNSSSKKARRLTKVVFTLHSGDFHAGASSLRFPLMALYFSVNMIQPQNVIPARATPALYHPGCTGARISHRFKISQRHRVNAKRPPVSVWNPSAGGLERVAHAQCLRFWIARAFYQHEVYLRITEIWNDPSSCKRDTRSNSHPGKKPEPVRVLSCKQPLTN